jgi:TetR/AcrR family transcriptional regulator, copper-responsive repressor
VRSARPAPHGEAPVAPARPRKPRGRPRSFDRESALQSAMEVFWKKGYEATSIADLTEAMGINPPSLYAAFGDKETLFLETIDRYQTRRGDSCPYCDEATARGSIETLLTYLARDFTDTCHPRGCLMMMAAATSGDSSVKLQKLLAEKRSGARARMKARIEKGIEDGDVPAGTDAGALSDFYSAVVMGMALQARDGATRKSLLATVERAMSLFPPVPRGFKPARVVCELA